ncbi:hypothetical protein BDV38DRAFT_14078 [Aspergillus pseudotamarii]|uniref:Uncharacterized protein n=1 Tax=Aspergillus pseudotamarii TaxID=132259 RepID=A0A5N6SE46_ASPPS|nr:uncharacterized protein BDV38DRAFT_14078 [Aspergillus pseudotamarii]KAE8131683.1 hypothetical protein BDV38DRAFT_14078 [Aspergillus pseudotamarii]
MIVVTLSPGIFFVFIFISLYLCFQINFFFLLTFYFPPSCQAAGMSYKQVDLERTRLSTYHK